MKFRKKQLVIEAICFNNNDLSEMLKAWGKDFARCIIEQEKDSHLIISTLEGDNIIASFGDWIIKGIKGEFYPCKPDIFEMTYLPEHPEVENE